MDYPPVWGKSTITHMSSVTITRIPHGFSPDNYEIIVKGFQEWRNNNDRTARCPSSRSSRVPTDDRTLTLSNKTLFHVKEAPPSKRKVFHRLKENQHDYQNDRSDTDTVKRANEQYKCHLIWCLGTHMGMLSHQISRAMKEYMALDIGKMGMNKELIALCVLLKIMREDKDDNTKQWNRSYHPNQGKDSRDGEIDEVVTSLQELFTPITSTNIIKVYNRLFQNPPLRESNQWRQIIREHSRRPI